MKNFLFIVAAILAINFAANAQNTRNSEEVKEVVKEYAAAKVNEFNGYLSYIATKSNPKTLKEQREISAVKDSCIADALKLFIGNGKASKDIFGNVIPAPRMQVSAKRRNGSIRINTLSVYKYLNNLKNMSYTKVDIKSSKAVYISDLRQIAENKYETVFSFAQIFVGSRDGIVVYKDETKKSVKVYITATDYGNNRIIYDVLLGDISVDATE